MRSSAGCDPQPPPTPNARSCLMPRLDALGAVEGELGAGGAVLGDDRLAQERVVIAGVDALQDPPDEPVAAAVDYRHALRSLVPLDLRELVDLVAGLAAEQLGEAAGVGGEEVDAERGLFAGHAERSVL